MCANIQQGRMAGRHWPAEMDEYIDPNTGATVRQLTQYPGSDNRHLYFTEPGWYDNENRLLVRAYRDHIDQDENLPAELSLPRQLYSIDIRTGLITQLTDLTQGFTHATKNHVRPEAYFWCDDYLVALDITTLDTRILYEKPSGYKGSRPGATAHGKVICTAIVEDIEDGSQTHRPPNSRVIAVSVDSEEERVLHEEECHISHVNTSPTRPELITFCHEGTWDEVDHRIWGLNIESGETWKIRRQDDGEAVGHEYWLADGETIGYHGWTGSKEAPNAFFGHIRYDNADKKEWPAPDIYTHFHSNTRELVVGDGTHRGIPYNLIWKYDQENGEYRGPRKLATTDWRNDGRQGPGTTHPHSQIDPSGDRVVFDSDRGGMGSDVFIVDIPSFEELPPL